MVTLEEFRKAFNPRQPRDAHGRWAGQGGVDKQREAALAEVSRLKVDDDGYARAKDVFAGTAKGPYSPTDELTDEAEAAHALVREHLEAVQAGDANAATLNPSELSKLKAGQTHLEKDKLQSLIKNFNGEADSDWAHNQDLNPFSTGEVPTVWYDKKHPNGVVVDGHHRVAAAIMLGTDISVVKVDGNKFKERLQRLYDTGKSGLSALLAQIKSMKWEAKANVSAIVDSFDWGEWHSDMRDAIEKPFSDVVLEQAERAAELVGDAFDRDDPFVRRTTTEYVGKLIKQLDKTTKSEVSDLIRRELEAGTQGSPLELGDKIAAAVRRKFADYADWRADRIARTETANAYNMGSLLAWQAAGVTHVLVSDGDQDAECAAADGQIWTLGRAMANLTAHPNCERAFSPLDGDGKAFDFGGRTK